MKGLFWYVELAIDKVIIEGLAKLILSVWFAGEWCWHMLSPAFVWRIKWL